MIAGACQHFHVFSPKVSFTPAQVGIGNSKENISRQVTQDRNAYRSLTLDDAWIEQTTGTKSRCSFSKPGTLEMSWEKILVEL